MTDAGLQILKEIAALYHVDAKALEQALLCTVNFTRGELIRKDNDVTAAYGP